MTNKNKATGDRSSNSNRISGLGDLIAAAERYGTRPVEAWDPPYCGDIGMKIRADGQWIYAGGPITRMRLVKLFASILRRDDDGRHYLVTPVEKVDVEVADAPFLAVEMEVTGGGPSQVLTFRTNVDDVVRCGVGNEIVFRVDQKGGGLKPYVLVRGRLEALVTRALYYDLMELAIAQGSDVDADGMLVLWSDGVKFPLVAQA